MKEAGCQSLRKVNIVSLGVHVTDVVSAARTVVDWAERGASAIVCVATVHMVMTAWDDDEYREVVERADLVVPDGMPLAWGQRALGSTLAQRVCGEDLTKEILAYAARSDIAVGFYGGDPVTLRDLVQTVRSRWPGVKVRYAVSPEFGPARPLTEREARAVQESGVRVLFVGLGCPKQERWMALNHEKAGCVLIGVGAAFDFLSGHKRRPSKWWQALGLEWLYRMFAEPRRLFWRYAYNNPRFIALFLLQWTRSRFV